MRCVIVALSIVAFMLILGTQPLSAKILAHPGLVASEQAAQLEAEKQANCLGGSFQIIIGQPSTAAPAATTAAARR